VLTPGLVTGLPPWRQRFFLRLTGVGAVLTMIVGAPPKAAFLWALGHAAIVPLMGLVSFRLARIMGARTTLDQHLATELCAASYVVPYGLAVSPLSPVWVVSTMLMLRNRWAALQAIGFSGGASACLAVASLLVAVALMWGIVGIPLGLYLLFWRVTSGERT
jgi:hypothetical protein